MAAEYFEKVNDWDFQEWDFVGRRIEESEQGRYDEEEGEKGVGADEYYPMMLYAYPLREKPSDETIREIHKKTTTTVVAKKETDGYYLALTGGGMDLSQDIALAYLIAEDRVPPLLARNVSTQEGLSQRGENFKRVMEGCKKALENDKRQANWKLEEIEEELTEED